MSSPSGDPFLESLYARAPQMRDYDALEPVLHPYFGFTSPLNFSSPSVTTDSAGFRRAEHGGRVVSSETALEGAYGVALGASFTFGVGATHDRHSLVSRLGEETGKPYLNRAVRAGNSLQELLAALPVLDGAEDVVICSGANNLGLAFSSARTWDGLGALFYDEWTALLAGRPLRELADAVGGSSLRGTLRAAAAARGRQPPGGAPRPRLEPDGITSQAAERHLRELRIAVAAARSATRLAFVVQPFADPRLREPHPEEFELIRAREGPAVGFWGPTMEFLGEHWRSYTEKLRRGCEDLGVRFEALEASEFEGWAYLDRVHMTDHGQRQAAARIAEVLRR